MQNKPYSLTTGFEEINFIIEKSNESSSNIIWQTFEDERVVYDIFSMDLDFKSKILSVLCSNSCKKFEKSNSTYLKLDFRKSLFKVEIISIDDKVLTLKIPDEAMAIEERRAKRVTLENDKSIQINFESNNLKLKSHFEFIVSDISTSGCSLIIDQNEIDLFINCNNMFLEKIGNISLFKPIETIIVYSHEIELDHKKPTPKKRVGLIFREKLSQQLIKDFANS